jgi:hypothetical protein
VGCFDSFFASGDTALFQPQRYFHYKGHYGVSSASILSDQFGHGASAAQAFQALAAGGYNTNPSYGVTVAGPDWLGRVDAIEDCLRSRRGL